MNIPRLGPIADGLILETDIPLSWQVISSKPTAYECLKSHELNRQVLQLLLKESAVQDKDVIADPVSHELNRLDTKIDLLISMVGTLLSRDTDFPADRKVWLGSEGFQVLPASSYEDDAVIAGLPEIPLNEYDPVSPASNDLIKVSMFLDPQLPQSLTFFASVEVVRLSGAGSLVVATFRHKDQDVQDLLEKFIFQQHRRVIASSRVAYSEH